jgi:hypothetical protein
VSWFKALPIAWQHLLVALTVTGLTWVGKEEIPVLQEHNPLLAGLVATLATLLLGALTPGVPYGVAKPPAED